MSDRSNDVYLPSMPKGFDNDPTGGPWSYSQMLEYGRLCWAKGREHGRGDTIAVQPSDKTHFESWKEVIKNLQMDRS